MSNRKQLWIVVPFLTVVVGISIINLLSLDRLESSAENRMLQQKPGINNIINKDHSTLYETYYTDQFLGRDRLLKLYTKLEVAMKKSTVRDYYIINDEWIMPINVAKKQLKELQKYANKLNNFAKSIDKESKDIFYVSTPSKSIALNHLYPKYAERNYGIQNIKKFISLLDRNNIESINIDENFKESFTKEELESFYFKTDHHWNGLGAFEGFKHIIKETNYLSDDDYNEIFSENNYIKYDDTSKSFLGSYNRNLFSIFDKDENVPYIYNQNSKEYEFLNYNGIEYTPMEEKLIIAPERDLEEITYGGAYTYDLPLYKVINNEAPIKKKILIVRDSFQAPTTLMFSDLFETVEVLDPRNSMDLTPSKVINDSDPDIVMFMFNSSSFGNMVDLVK
jgi:hypothetical protein